jgi:hypothetical protein
LLFKISVIVCLLIILVAAPLPSVIAFNASLNNNNSISNNSATTSISTIISNEANKSDSLIPYTNPAYGIQIQYPSDWKLVERSGNGYHMLNVIVELLQPNQSSYYNTNISASHNSLRLSVEDYSTFEEPQNNDNPDSQLLNIGNHRIGSIGISCPGFDIKSYNRNTTLAGHPAYQISFDYSYMDSNKMATEIWTIKDNKVYIVDYVANENAYNTTLPVVKKMIESFEITT